MMQVMDVLQVIVRRWRGMRWRVLIWHQVMATNRHPGMTYRHLHEIMKRLRACTAGSSSAHPSSVLEFNLTVHNLSLSALTVGRSRPRGGFIVSL